MKARAEQEFGDWEGIMPWECGECNAREGRRTRINAVCHH